MCNLLQFFKSKKTKSVNFMRIGTCLFCSLLNFQHLAECLLHSRHLTNIRPSSGFSSPFNILHNTQKPSRLWANSANKGTSLLRAWKGKNFKYLWFDICPGHTDYSLLLNYLLELFWQLNFLKIDTVSTSQNRAMMDSVKKEKVEGSLWNEIIIRPGYKWPWSHACRSPEGRWRN